MNLSFSQNIKVAVSDKNDNAILDLAEAEFKKVAKIVKEKDGGLEVTSINASFGSINRKDVSTITISKNRNNDGYVINCDTSYKPSMAFWILFIIDVMIMLFLNFIFGVIAFAIVLGMYFYNKTLVEKGVKDALDKIKNNIE